MIDGDGEREETGFPLFKEFSLGDRDDPGRREGGCFAGIVVNRPIDQVFTYRVGPGLCGTIAPGQRARAAGARRPARRPVIA